MMKFTTLEKSPIFVDPREIVMIVPAYAPPPAGVPDSQWIPRTIGSQIFLRNGMKVGVSGDLTKVAADVETAKAPLVIYN